MVKSLLQLDEEERRLLRRLYEISLERMIEASRLSLQHQSLASGPRFFETPAPTGGNKTGEAA